MPGMIQAAKVDFAPSHSGSFPLSEAVRGKAWVGIHRGVRKKTMGGIRVRGRGGSLGAYLSRKRGAAASQGQRNRF